jgi:hypothetical protein
MPNLSCDRTDWTKDCYFSVVSFAADLLERLVAVAEFLVLLEPEVLAGSLWRWELCLWQWYLLDCVAQHGPMSGVLQPLMNRCAK